ATHKKHRLLEVLLSLPGYSINQNHVIHSTPLKCAVASRDPKMVSHIIKLGADVNLDSWSHGSLLHLAASRDDFEVTELLLEAGMDPNIKDVDGETPLDWVVERASWPVAQLLIRFGATINHQNSETGMTPLHRAVIDIGSRNGLDMIRGLLNEGASPNILNNAWLTPLGIARRMQSYALVDLLFYYGADQGAKDFFGY
ncbi:ankyrin repeat-containing domain protein, partial [Tuber indicum]